MEKFTKLGLISLLAMQIIQVVALQPIIGGVETSFIDDVAHPSTSVPLHHVSHASQLIETQDFPRTYGAKTNLNDLTLYIHRKTAHSLPEAWRPKARQIAQAIIDSANQAQMDPLFLIAIVTEESRFRPDAIGRHGEIGLMQIKPETARWILKKHGLMPWAQKNIKTALQNPEMNIRIGTVYLSYLREKFGSQDHAYISAYNMGAQKVRNFRKVGHHPRAYADRVLEQYQLIASGFERPAVDLAMDTTLVGP